jgi:hypothetical protein
LIGLPLNAGVEFSPSELAVATAMALFLALTIATRAKFHRSTGEDEEIARLCAIEEIGASVAFAALAAVAALLPWIAFVHAAPALALLPLAAGIVALVGVPAVTTAIAALLPRRRSVEEIYGHR